MPSRLACAATLAVVAVSVASASPARATVIFREDFEKGTLGRFASGSNTLPGRVVVVMKGAEVVDQGNYAVKVTMLGTERFNAQQLRVQLAPIYVDVVAGRGQLMSPVIYAHDPPKTAAHLF